MGSTTSLAVLYAVVLGWNGSPSPDVARLRFADDDAAEYARLFRDAGARTVLLTTLDDDSRALHEDARPDGAPTLAALQQTLDRIDDEIARSGVPGELLIVYSGHGDVDHGEGFVQLDGARLTRGALYDRVLANRRASRIHVIVDACKSYYLVYGRGGEGGGRRPFLQPFAVDERTPERLPRVGFTLSTSSATDSHEWEDFGGGVFSHEVRSALRGAADVDGDGGVSYAELGAFVETANAAIPNPRFRPRFTVAAPAASKDGARTKVLSWPAPGNTRRLHADVPALGRISVEDAAGRRLADAHLGAPATLHLPASGALFVIARGADREYEIPPPEAGSAAPQHLSALAPRPRRVAARGALHEAFARLFLLPFERIAVERWIERPRAIEPDTAPATPSLRRPIALASLGVAAGALAAGIGCSVAGALVRNVAGEASQVDRAAANERIASLNTAAVPLYVVSGAAAAAWAILSLWPDGNRAARSPPRAGLSVGPGPGAVGIALDARFP